MLSVFYWRHFQIHVRVSPMEVSSGCPANRSLMCKVELTLVTEPAFRFPVWIVFWPANLMVNFDHSPPLHFLIQSFSLNPLPGVLLISITAAFLTAFLSTEFPLLSYYFLTHVFLLEHWSLPLNLSSLEPGQYWSQTDLPEVLQNPSVAYCCLWSLYSSSWHAQ